MSKLLFLCENLYFDYGMIQFYHEFSDVYQETERYITNDDYDVYLKLINDSDFNKHIMDYNKTKFYNTKLDNENIKEIISNLKLKKENCCL